MEIKYIEETEEQEYERIMENCRRITKDKIAEVLEVNSRFLNTEQGRVLVEEQLYGVLLHMYSYIQNQMTMSRKEKQKKGIEAAKQRGIHIGRKQKFVAEDYVDIFRKVERGEIDMDTAISEIGSCRTTFVKMQRELKDKKLI